MGQVNDEVSLISPSQSGESESRLRWHAGSVLMAWAGIARVDQDRSVDFIYSAGSLAEIRIMSA